AQGGHGRGGGAHPPQGGGGRGDLGGDQVRRVHRLPRQGRGPGGGDAGRGRRDAGRRAPARGRQRQRVRAESLGGLPRVQRGGRHGAGRRVTTMAAETWPIIRKGTWPGGVRPNVVDYDAARAAFTWEQARRSLDGLPGGQGLNIAHEAVDRHAAGPRRDRVAVRWLRKDGRVDEATYAQLAAASNRFANVLTDLGIGRGDRVFTLLGRVPELYVTVLGALKRTAVVSPLFSAFGPEPIRQRLELGDGRVLVTTPALYRRKVASVRRLLPRLEHVILVGTDGHPTDVE